MRSPTQPNPRRRAREQSANRAKKDGIFFFAEQSVDYYCLCAFELAALCICAGPNVCM